MNEYEMVVGIILIVMIASVIKARAKFAAQSRVDATDPEAGRLRDEVRLLKERVQVLERVITDNHQSVDLDRQIERLRDR